MSARDKARRVATVLVLMAFACSLAVHFMAEGISPAGSPGFGFITEIEHTHLVHEHGEDHFVLIRLIPSSLDHAPKLISSPDISTAFLYSISPLLPPPNF